MLKRLAKKVEVGDILIVKPKSLLFGEFTVMSIIQTDPDSISQDHTPLFVCERKADGNTGTFTYRHFKNEIKHPPLKEVK